MRCKNGGNRRAAGRIAACERHQRPKQATAGSVTAASSNTAKPSGAGMAVAERDKSPMKLSAGSHAEGPIKGAAVSPKTAKMAIQIAGIPIPIGRDIRAAWRAVDPDIRDIRRTYSILSAYRPLPIKSTAKMPSRVIQNSTRFTPFYELRHFRERFPQSERASVPRRIHRTPPISSG